MQTKIVNKTGFGVTNWIEFEAESSSRITVDDALRAQSELGYLAQGYGFDSFKSILDPVLMRYKATWRCQASCD